MTWSVMLCLRCTWASSRLENRTEKQISQAPVIFVGSVQLLPAARWNVELEQGTERKVAMKGKEGSLGPERRQRRQRGCIFCLPLLTVFAPSWWPGSPPLGPNRAIQGNGNRTDRCSAVWLVFSTCWVPAEGFFSSLTSWLQSLRRMVWLEYALAVGAAAFWRTDYGRLVASWCLVCGLVQ